MEETNPTNNESRYEGYKSFSERKEELESYPEVQTWLKTVSETSRRYYRRALTKLCDFCGKTPDQLILERDKEIRNPDPNSRTGIRDLILDFRTYLEKEGYAPKSINAYDGAVRSFFTAVLGREGMVNVKNYRNRDVVKKKDLVPTLEELKKMLDAVNLEEKFRILFIAQTGMRVSDALALKVGDVERELELGRVPLAITYLPKKDREMIGERITFLASDGVELLKRYLEWRKKKGEKITEDSPLFVGRSKKYGKKATTKITTGMMTKMIKKAAEKAGIGNGNGKYGRVRIHGLRKFFVTQLTNHGVEDKIVNFFIGHKISDVDRVYWSRRVESLREIYRQREKFLNPITETRHEDLKKMKDLIAKVKEMEEKLNGFPGDRLKEKVNELEEKLGVFTEDHLKDMVKESIRELGYEADGSEKYDVKIVASEEEIISLARLGYDCQPIAPDRWLMRCKNGGLVP